MFGSLQNLTSARKPNFDIYLFQYWYISTLNLDKKDGVGPVPLYRKSLPIDRELLSLYHKQTYQTTLSSTYSYIQDNDVLVWKVTLCSHAQKSVLQREYFYKNKNVLLILSYYVYNKTTRTHERAPTRALRCISV